MAAADGMHSYSSWPYAPSRATSDPGDMQIPLDDASSHEMASQPAPSLKPTYLEFDIVAGHEHLLKNDNKPIVLDSSREKNHSSSAKALFFTCCQALRIKFLYVLVARCWGEHVEEGPKVVYYQSRAQALMRCCVHLLPVSGGIVLVFMNTWQYYIGGELAGASGADPQKLAGLQFAAKLEELLILTSLGTIIWTYIRKELVSQSGLPFGALFAGQSNNSISFLWSLEFFGIIFQAWYKGRRKWTLICLIILSAVLGASVGPSTAILMIPRLNNWPAGGTTFWAAATNDTLFPTTVVDSPRYANCSQDTGDLSCPHGEWNTLAQQYLSFWPKLSYHGTMPEYLYLTGQYSIREHWITSRNTVQRYPAAWTIATGPPAGVANGLAEVGRLWAVAAANADRKQRFMFRKDALFNTSTYQHNVMTRCAAQDPTQLAGDYSQVPLLFPNVDTMTVVGTEVENLWFIISDNTTLHNIAGDMLSATGPNAYPSLYFVEDMDLLELTNATLSIIAAFPNTTAGVPTIYCCSVDSRLTPVTIQVTRNRLKYVTGTPAGWSGKGSLGKKVKIDTQWARYLNPTIDEFNRTVFAELSSVVGMWNTTTTTKFDDFEVIVESVINSMVMNGLSRLNYDVGLAGNLLGGPDAYSDYKGAWMYEFMPKGRLGPGGNGYNVSHAEQLMSTQYIMTAFANGYAFSYVGATVKAAIAVITTYMVLALLHVVSALLTGWSSTAWDTAPEVTVLGFNSDRSKCLDNTGAGVETMGAFEKRVKIRLKDKRVQVVFDDTNDVVRLVVHDKEYC